MSERRRKLKVGCIPCLELLLSSTRLRKNAYMVEFPNVNSKMLGNVIKYYKKQIKAASFTEANEDGRSSDDALNTWEADFVKLTEPTLSAMRSTDDESMWK